MDVYADQFGLNIGPFGCSINFSISSAMPPPPGGAVQGQSLGTVRMSLEHLKVMTYLMRRQLLEFERTTGVQVPVAREVLNQLRIGPEDWTECWGGGR